MVVVTVIVGVVRDSCGGGGSGSSGSVPFPIDHTGSTSLTIIRTCREVDR